MRKMRKMRNCAQLIFVARKMRKFAPTRKPVALETLVDIHIFTGGNSGFRVEFERRV